MGPDCVTAQLLLFQVLTAFSSHVGIFELLDYRSIFLFALQCDTDDAFDGG